MRLCRLLLPPRGAGSGPPRSLQAILPLSPREPSLVACMAALLVGQSVLLVPGSCEHAVIYHSRSAARAGWVLDYPLVRSCMLGTVQPHPTTNWARR